MFEISFNSHFVNAYFFQTIFDSRYMSSWIYISISFYH